MNNFAASLDTFLTPIRLKTYSAILFLAIAVPVVLAIVLPQQFYWAGSRTRTDDFVVFYHAGRLADAGRPLDAYNYRLISVDVYNDIGNPPTDLASLPDFAADWPVYVYSPPFTLLLEPLAQLPFLVALTIWELLGLFAVIASMYLLRRSLPFMQRHPLWLAVALALCFWPLDNAFFDGQNTCFTLFFFTGAYYFSRPSKTPSPAAAGEGWGGGDWLAGLFGAALAVEKPQLLLGIGLVWLLTLRWRALLALIIGSTVAVGISLLLLPAAMYPAWISNLLGFGNFGNAANFAGSVVTLRAVLHTWLPLPGLVSEALYYAFFVAAIAAVAWAVYRLRSSSLDVTRQHLWLFIIATCFSLATPAYLIFYDLALLLLPVLLLFGIYDGVDRPLFVRLKLITMLLYLGLILSYLLATVLHVQLAVIVMFAYIAYVGYLFWKDTSPHGQITDDLALLNSLFCSIALITGSCHLGASFA